MGGVGSGRSAGYGFLVDKCEDFLRIDLAFLRKRNVLTVGNSGQLAWSRRGEQYASIRYVVEPAGLRLVYRTRPRGGDWQDVIDLIPLAETPDAVWREPSVVRVSKLFAAVPDHLRRIVLSVPEVPRPEVREPIRRPDLPRHQPTAQTAGATRTVRPRSTSRFRISPRACIGRHIGAWQSVTRRWATDGFATSQIG